MLGWTCDDGTECTVDAMGGTLDENGEAGCDAACDPNGKDAAGMDCTAMPTPTPTGPTCTFDAAGWMCDDNTSCTADAMGATMDQDGTAGCDATCAPDMKDNAGNDCGRRLAVQTMIGQN